MLVLISISISISISIMSDIDKLLLEAAIEENSNNYDINDDFDDENDNSKLVIVIKI